MIKKGAAVIFFISLILFLCFMLRFRDGIPQNFAIFWALVSLLFISVIYQIFRFGDDKGWANFILLQLVFLAFSFGIIYPMLIIDRTAFPIDDSYVTLSSAEYIKSHTDFWASGPYYNKWPILQHLLLLTSETTGIKLFDIGLILPPIYSILWIVFIYLIARELYGDNKKVALLAALVSIPLLFRMLTPATINVNTLAKVFFMVCIFAYITGRFRRETSTAYPFLAVFFLFMVTLTHHATNMFLAFFFIASLLAAGLRELVMIHPLSKFLKFAQPSGRLSPSSFLGFTLLAAVGWLAYWMYMGETIFNLAVQSIAGVEAPSVSFEAKTYTYTLEPTIRNLVLYWEGVFYVVLFAVMLIYEVFRRRRCPSWESDFLLAVWALFCLALWMVANAMGTEMFTPERVVRFTYPFILMAVAHIILSLNSRVKGLLFTALLLLFMLFNIYGNARITPENPLAQHTPPLPEPGGGIQQVQAASWYHGEGAAVTVVNMRLMFEYLHYPVYAADSILLFEEDMAELRDYSLLYLDTSASFVAVGRQYTAGHVPLSEKTRSKIATASWLNRVYNSNRWEVYSISK